MTRAYIGVAGILVVFFLMLAVVEIWVPLVNPISDLWRMVLDGIRSIDFGGG